MFDGVVLSTIPAEDASLRQPIRRLLSEILPAATLDARVRSWSAGNKEFSRSLASAGYLGLTLPKRYGGQERSHFARFVLAEELLSVGAPVAAHWIGDRQSANQILKFGSESQRTGYLPRICRGEIFFCIGMSEPGSGSDLASVRSRADRVSGGWKLNGQKIWTTSASLCDYMIALVRTSGTAEDRHKGLSQVIVDLKSPGVTIRPIKDLAGDCHFSEVFFDDVLLSDEAIIGAEGDGWRQVTAELAFERSGPERIYSSLILLEAWISHLRDHDRMDESAVALVGQFTAQLAALRALSISVTAKLESGESPVVEAALVKDLGTEFEQSIPRLIADDLGRNPHVPVSEDLRRALFYLIFIAPSFSLRGGTREILRGIIARSLESC